MADTALNNTRPHSNRRTVVVIAIVTGGLLLVMGIVTAVMYFMAPRDKAQRLVIAVMSSQYSVLADQVHWESVRAQAARAMRERDALKAMQDTAQKQISRTPPKSMMEGFANALGNVLVHAATDWVTDAVSAHINETTLTAYLQGAIQYVSAGQSVKANGSMTDLDTYVLTLSGGHPTAELRLYFYRFGFSDWKLIGLEAPQ